MKKSYLFSTAAVSVLLCGFLFSGNAHALAPLKDEPTDIPPVVVEGKFVLKDPYENTNRDIYDFNTELDHVTLKPVATGYKAAVPEWGRDRVSSFVSNLNEPVVMVNSALQGKGEKAMHAFWRFMVNSTIGIGGLFDQAQYAGLTQVHEDFDQTLAHYDVESGPYVVLPLLGSTTVRGIFGRVVDTVMSPATYTANAFQIPVRVADVVDTRTDLLDFTNEVEETSLDPYSTIRSSYEQHRASLIDDVKP